MAKTLHLKSASDAALRRRKTALLDGLCIPADAIRASCVRQYLTCGKRNCRCQRGAKHGPFHYLVQCVATGSIRKFLLKTAGQQEQARQSIAAHRAFQERLEELSQINAELLRRGLLFTPT